MSIHLSITLDEERQARFEQAAAHEGVSPGELLNRLVDQRLSSERWFLEKVQEGIDQADQGLLIPHEEVVESGRRLLEELRAQQRR